MAMSVSLFVLNANVLSLDEVCCHLPYGITQCCMPPDTSEHAPPERLVLDLPTLEGWKV